MNHQPRRRCRALLLAATAASAFSTSTLAQVNGTWLGITGDTWSVGANWSSYPQTPGSGGEASFGIGSSGTIVLDAPVTLSALHFDANGSVRLTGPAVLTLVGPAVIDAPRSSGYYDNLSPTSGNWAPHRGHLIGTTIAGTSGLLKTGAGIVSLSEPNTLTGGVSITGGTLRGSFQGNVTLDGGSFNGSAGQIVIGANGGTLLDSDGPIVGSGTLTTVFTRVISTPSAFSGPVRVVDGNLWLMQQGSIESNQFEVNGSQLTLDNTNGTYNDRLGNDAEIRLISGTWNITYRSGFPMSEHASTVTFAGGMGTISASTTIGPVPPRQLGISVGHLGRENRGVAVLEGNENIQLGNGAALLVGGGGAAGSTNQSIIPFAIGTSGRMVTHSAFGVRELTASEYLTYASPAVVPAMVTDENVNLSGVQVPNPITVNSLLATGSIEGNGTITVTSGLVANGSLVNSDDGISAPIDFGNSEGILLSSESGTNEKFGLAISGPIYGNNGLTIAGPKVRLSGSSSYTGLTTIVGNFRLGLSVPASGPGPLGSDTSAVEMIGKDAAITPSGGNWFDRNIVIKSIGASTHYMGPTFGPGLFVHGDVALEQWANMSTSTEISGEISGPGGLNYVGTNGGYFVLSGNNSFEGGIDVHAGLLRIASDTALGTGLIRIGSNSTAGTLRAQGAPRTVHNPIQLTGLLTLGTGSNLTLAGPVDLNGFMNGGFTNIQVSSNISATISGTISGGTLGFFNSTLKLTGDNEQLATYIKSGTLIIDHEAALGRYGSFTKLIGGTLQFGGGIQVQAQSIIMDTVSLGTIRSTDGHNTWSGATDIKGIITYMVDSGTLSIPNAGGIPGFIFKLGSGALEVPNLRPDVKVDAGGGMIRVLPNGTDAGTSNTYLQFTAPTTIDLADNDLAARNDIDQVRTLLASGALTSSMADGIYGLDYADNSILGYTTFSGQSVESNQTLIKYTYRGDANLDGKVDMRDLQALLTSWNTSNVGYGADFNYDGFIDRGDLSYIARNWQAGVNGGQLVPLGATLAAMGLPDVTVPEPGSIALLAGLGLLSRRGRRGSIPS